VHDPSTGYERLTLEQSLPVDEACDRFESAWRAGGRPDIAEHLHRAAGADAAVLLRELVLLDIDFRRRTGQTPKPEDYATRFAGLDADWLARALLPTTGIVPLPPTESGFEVVAELGRGGMGVVYKARDARLDRFVALKFLTAGAGRDPRRLERFRREARAASALNHPAVCTLHDVGDHDGQPFLIFEWVDGQTFRALIGPNPDLQRLLPLVRQVAEALRVAHAAGIVHRDLKPENLMVRSDGYVKILDFGLARLADAARHDSEVGMVVGTADYMPPEQARGEAVGPSADIYSLGVIFYELTTGRNRPEPGVTAAAIRQHHPEVPAGLAEVIAQMLDADPRCRPTAAEVEAALGGLTHGAGRRAGPTVLERRPTVGRKPEHAALRAAFDRAAGGHGSVVCVTGEPGIGKTTIVEAVLAELAAAGHPYATARGRCSERLAGADAYLPVLEALDGLLAGESGESAARALRLLAPSWHGLIAPAGAAVLQPIPQDRLKRELVALFADVTRLRPVVLFLDDLHWADVSTVDLLGYLGERCGGMRLLVVLTARPSELVAGRHPFAAVKHALQARGLCREVALPLLSPADLDAYLALTFPGHDFPDDFAEAVFAKTGGNPLFMADLVRDLRDRGNIVRTEGGWRLDRPLPEFLADLPESIRGLIQHRTERLDEMDRLMLLAASVQGPAFDSAPVARVLGCEPTAVEDRLDALDRVHGLVRLEREREYADGTLTLRYSFVHAVYQNALYASLPPSRRAAWSATTAEALLAHHGENNPAVAAELALLFEAARDRGRAARFFRSAAENAVHVSAHREAVALADRGLRQLERLADPAERGRQELALLVARGVAQVAIEGFASPAVERTYTLARAAGERCGGGAALFPVFYGLWNVHLLRCELRACGDLASRMLALASAPDDPVLRLQAHNVRQQPLVHLGQFAAARDHQDQALAIYDPGRHGTLTDVFGEDPGIGCLVYRAVALWHMGLPDQAVAAVGEARRLADQLGYPFNQARVLYYTAFLHVCRREPNPVGQAADELTRLSEEQGFAMLAAAALIFRGWYHTQVGRLTDGVVEMRRGLESWRATGSRSHYPYLRALLGEAVGRAGRPGDGLATANEALSAMEATEERFYEPEIHRIRAELLDQCGADDDARLSFHRALDTSRAQQATGVELRAAVSLARHHAARGRRDEAAALVAPLLATVSEGQSNPDVTEAAELLSN
jgi:predicted ATPase